MRLPKKIYPFAIVISLVLVLAVFYILNQGHIEKISNASVSADIAKQNNVLFVEYDMVWSGYGQPKVNDITILDKPEDKALQQVKITPYFDTSSTHNAGVLTEKEVIEGGYADKYASITDYKITDKQFRLILKLEFEDLDAINDINYARIKYNTFGIMKEQLIHLEDIVD